MEVQKSIRYRVNISTSVKGVKTWDCTVEYNHDYDSPNIINISPLDASRDMEFTLGESDKLVKELEKRYPKEGMKEVI